MIDLCRVPNDLVITPYGLRRIDPRAIFLCLAIEHL